MEVLAPCGDGESFEAAINNGADAIYLGLGDFNARAKATFFNLENIRFFIERAHLFGVKVYITTNTLLKDDEIPSFLEFAKKCIQARADAFIVQDLAVANILRDAFDNVEIHASTQLGIHNVEGAKIAKELGFTRVVLSRETKLDDIRAIKKETGLEIEYFVQGALCVAFSGNCYLSALEHDKSGNRGQCLQLCRLPYTAYIDNKKIGTGFLLSARDLCLIENLAELKNAGVDSLKIEGRLRRPAYVAQSVKSYRFAVDALKNNEKINFNTEINVLKKVFARGEYNKRAYLDSGTPDNIINPTIQNHLGEKIGFVEKITPFKDLFKITLKLNTEIHSGDGLKFLDKQENERASLGVGNIEKIDDNRYNIYSKTRVKQNYTVYRTLDKFFEENLLSNSKKLGIDCVFDAQENKPFTLEFLYTTKDGKISAKITSDYIVSRAQNSPTSQDEILTQINKLNDTDFVLENAKITAQNLFIPKSILNQARRDDAMQLRQDIIEKYENNIKSAENTQKFSTMQHFLGTMQQKFARKYNNMYVVNENNLSPISEITNNDLVIINPLSYNLEKILKIKENFIKNTANFALELPIISNGKDIKILNKIIEKLPADFSLVINNLSGLIYTKTNRNIIAGLGMNVYNILDANILSNLGVSEIIWSKERKSPSENFYQLTFGKHSLMSFAHCPFKTLFKNSCKNCKFSKNLKFVGNDGREYNIFRHTISSCYFTLFSNKLIDKRQATRNLIDLRFINNK